MLCIIFSELKFCVLTVDFTPNSQELTQIQLISLILGGLKKYWNNCLEITDILYELQCFKNFLVPHFQRFKSKLDKGASF